MKQACCPFTDLYFTFLDEMEKKQWRYKLFLDWKESLELPLQERSKGTGNYSVLLASTWETPCVPSCYSTSTASISLRVPIWCPAAFFISGFGIRIQTYKPETMERLRSNRSHIFGSRREIMIKVFSKFARRLGWGVWVKFEGDSSLSHKLASLSSSGKAIVLQSPRKHLL